jgi:hypothetical protein
VLHPHNSLFELNIHCILSNDGKNLAPLQGVDNFSHKFLLLYLRVLGIEYGTHP